MSEKDFDRRPWGVYTVLERGIGYWIKRIEVDPGQKISFQYHNHRSEEWIVVHGSGYVIKNRDTIRVREGSHIHIGVAESHRIINDGVFPLVFIEVALGTELTEDDIVRIEDDYGRK